MTSEPDKKTEGTYFKEEIEQVLERYVNMTVYEAIGALEIVKSNLIERLKEADSDDE